MSISEKTQKRDLLPFLVHRVLGIHLYATDIDTIMIASGEAINGVFAEMDSSLDFVAFIDYKHPTETHQNIDLSSMAVRAQARHATKNNLPFFVVLTYIDPDVYEKGAYYVIAINGIAKSILPKERTWLTIRQFSWWQHYLRKQKWRPSEIIPKDAKSDKTVRTIIRDAKTLGELPSEKITYPLPSFSL